MCLVNRAMSRFCKDQPIVLDLNGVRLKIKDLEVRTKDDLLGTLRCKLEKTITNRILT